MSTNIVLVIVTGALFAAGIYLMLERSLTRVLVGLILTGNGVNVLFLLASGRAGGAPIVGITPTDEMSDPLPQALVLTAIVITLGVASFLLAMAYRSWQLTRHDDVQDDVEDALIRRLAEHDETSHSYDDTTGGMLDEEGSDTDPPEGPPGPPDAPPEGSPDAPSTAPIGPEGERP